jgi:hypothetical protein
MLFIVWCSYFLYIQTIEIAWGPLMRLLTFCPQNISRVAERAGKPLELRPGQVVHGVVVVARAQFIDKWRETCERGGKRVCLSLSPVLWGAVWYLVRCQRSLLSALGTAAAATVALIRADSAAFYLFYCGRYKSVTLIQGNILTRGSTRVATLKEAAALSEWASLSYAARRRKK